MKRFGFIQLPVLLGLLLLVVAVPISVKMVQESQDTRNKAVELDERKSWWHVSDEGECLFAGYYKDQYECAIVMGKTCHDNDKCDNYSIPEDPPPMPPPTGMPGLPSEFWIKDDGQCIYVGVFSDKNDCENHLKVTCYTDDSCEDNDIPPVIDEYVYLCDKTPGNERRCDSNNMIEKKQCEEMISSNPNLSCETDCNKCLLVYSACVPKSLLDKCPDGFKSQNPECKIIFGGSNYYYGDREYQFEARCSSFEGMLPHDCFEKFGYTNCFVKNSDCMRNCPIYKEDEEIKAYRCGENQSCLLSVYDSFEDCYKENGMLGCYDEEFSCNKDCGGEMVEYHYCDYSDVNNMFKKGSFRNIYECYSKHGKCSLVSYENRGCPPQDGLDKKLELYFCNTTGCVSGIFKNWKECGDKHGVCYDSANQCKFNCKVDIIPPTSCSLCNRYMNVNGRDIDTKLLGDANCDERIDSADYSIWFDESFEGKIRSEAKNNTWEADFSCERRTDKKPGRPTNIDYSIWYDNAFNK